MLKIHWIEWKSSQLDTALAYISIVWSGVANTIWKPTPNLRTKIDPATGEVTSYYANSPQEEQTKN